MYQPALQYFSANQIDVKTFDHFDYADLFQHLQLDKIMANPHKRKIVQMFIKKCEQQVKMKKCIKRSWKDFISRTQQFQKYRIQKFEALKFINERYDSKSNQLYFYPKLNKSHATQHGRHWKDVDDLIQKQGAICMPNQSTFIS